MHYFLKYWKLGPGLPTKHDLVKPCFLMTAKAWRASFSLLPKSNIQ